jgi:membrane-associated phospholipid phosphatase
VRTALGSVGAVTSGPDGRAGRPAAVRPSPVGVGRPPWWLVAAGAAVAGLVAVGLASGGWLLRLDQRVAAATGVAGLRTGVPRLLLELASQCGGRAVLAVVLLAVAGRAAWRQRTARPLVRAVLALVLLTAVVGAVKLGTGRPAPGSFSSRGGSSFPSGHVANAVVVWGVVRWTAVASGAPAAVQRLTARLAVAAPVVAGAAMLLLGFHWLSDVVAGVAVGVSLLGVVHALDGVVLSLWVRARAGRRTA